MYELTFLASPNLSEEEITDLLDKVKNTIGDLEGEVVQTLPSKKIYLAYPIKKQGYGILCSLDFNLSTEKVRIVEHQIKENENVMRYLLFTKKIPKEKPKKIKKVITGIGTAKAKVKPKEKIKIEELDKKLEELLQE